MVTLRWDILNLYLIDQFMDLRSHGNFKNKNVDNLETMTYNVIINYLQLFKSKLYKKYPKVINSVQFIKL